MKTKQFSASALIEASAQKVYDIIADYHHGHPKILPKPPFVSLSVEEGGVGAGTIINVKMRVLGQNQSFRSVVTEPEPGRVLVETNDNGYVTSFTVEPQTGGQQALVTISTKINRTGLLGALELLFMKRLMLPVFERELKQLSEVAVMDLHEEFTL